MVLLFSGTLRQLGYLESFAAHFFECPSACCPGGMLHRLVFSWPSCSILGFWPLSMPGLFGEPPRVVFWDPFSVLVFSGMLRHPGFLECFIALLRRSASPFACLGVLQCLVVFWQCFTPVLFESCPSLEWLEFPRWGLFGVLLAFVFLEALSCFPVSGILRNVGFWVSFTALPRRSPSLHTSLSVIHAKTPKCCRTTKKPADGAGLPKSPQMVQDCQEKTKR